MFSPVRARLVCAALVVASIPAAHARPLTLDLPTAVARARARAPEAIAALARIGDARARRAGAGVRPNPELDLGAGPRFGATRTLAVEAQLTQPLELGRRGARLRVADAELEHATATTEAALRELDLEVTNLFLDARFAELDRALAQRDVEVATRAAQAARRRRQAGDVTDLDVDLATIALGRARSALAAALARRAGAIGRLGAIIGAAPGDAITLVGDLRPPALALDRLRAAVLARPDLRALAAEAKVARAEAGLARANARPELGLWASYERDDADDVVLGGLTVTLPLWNRAQGARAAARVKLRRAERERAAVLAAASRQIVDAFEAYTRAREAVEVFDREVVPALADSEHLLERSLDTGQIAMSAYLVARQEILNGRREHLERQLQLAKAAAAARFVAGVAP